MGFNDAMSGYKKLKNTKGYSNQELLTLLQTVEFSCGKPEPGKAGKKEALIFPPIGRLMVYIAADDKNIEIAAVTAPGKAGKFVLKELGASLLTDATAKDTAEANRAVDEVYATVKGLIETGVAENKSAQDDGIKLYMRQKILAIKDKFSIMTLDEEPVYWVKGNLMSLKYEMQKADGTPVYEIRKKLVAVMPEFTVTQNGNTIATLKKKIRLTRPEILGTVEGKNLQIKGDLSGYHFSIAIDGQEVGSVDTERLTWGDVYSIGIKDSSRQEMIVAIAVMVDNMLRSK